MKQTLSFLMLFVVMSLMAQTDTLKLSFDVWPPFTNVQEEKSLATDIVKTALDRVNIKSALLVSDFESVTKGISSGKYDGSPAFWKSEERGQTLVFSDPYLENQLILVGRKGTDVSQTSFSELEQKRIGLVKDYAYGESLMDVPGLQVVYGNNDQENLVNLLSEKIDLMLVDALLIQYLLKYELNDVSALLEFAKKPIIVRPLHFALKKETPNVQGIMALFNEEIKKMMSDGSYNELLGLNWIKADIDGDGKLEIVLNGEAAGTEPPEDAYGVYYADAGNTDQYYIGGKYYDSWDEVPDKYKVIIPKEQYKLDPNSYGMTIKF